MSAVPSRPIVWQHSLSWLGAASFASTGKSTTHCGEMTLYSFCEQDNVGLLVIFAFQGVMLCFGLGDLFISDPCSTAAFSLEEGDPLRQQMDTKP